MNTWAEAVKSRSLRHSIQIPKSLLKNKITVMSNVYLFSTLSLIHVHETEMSYKDNEQWSVLI